MGLYLGIDSGGTKTRCVLGDDGCVLATGVDGGSNVVRLGEAAAREALGSAIQQACELGETSLDKIDAICIGAAGAARPEIAEKVRALIAGLHAGLKAPIEVVGDTVIALEAGFGSGPGVIAMAGTGSVAFGRDAAGRTARAGGWGFAVSDEGSGHWIGRQAVSAILRARDEQRETALAALILEASRLRDFDALIQYANATPPPEFPRLFRVVLRAAAGGDWLARKLLTRAGRELARLASIVVQRVGGAPPYVPVATTGSVFRQSEHVRRVFYNRLQAEFPGIELRGESVEPVMGALARARTAGKALTQL